MTKSPMKSGEFLKAFFPSGGFDIPHKTRAVEPFHHFRKQLAAPCAKSFHPSTKSRKLIVYTSRRNQTMAILLLEGFQLFKPFIQFVRLRVP